MSLILQAVGGQIKVCKAVVRCFASCGIPAHVVCEGLGFLVCLDGASACMKALRLLHAKFPHVFGQRCCLHAWSLVLGDIAKLVLFRDTIKKFLKLIVFINAHERAYMLLGKLGAAALLQAAPTRMGKEVLALQGLFKDRNKIEQLLVHDDMRDIIKSFDAAAKVTFETVRTLVFNSDEWSKLEVFQ